MIEEETIIEIYEEDYSEPAMVIEEDIPNLDYYKNTDFANTNTGIPQFWLYISISICLILGIILGIIFGKKTANK